MRTLSATLLTDKDIKRLPTKRLLTYFKKYRWLRWCAVCDVCRVVHEDDRERHEANCKYIGKIKEELDTREHVN